jgi:hypothetical protein
MQSAFYEHTEMIQGKHLAMLLIFNIVIRKTFALCILPWNIY